MTGAGRGRKNNKSVPPPISETDSHILQGWCKAYQKSTKGLLESQENVPLELTAKFCQHILIISYL